jgi:hypothetical protein
MKQDIDLIEHAACILDGEALSIRQCHNLNPNNPDWKDEPEAKEWHDNMKNTSTRLYELAERMRTEQTQQEQ